MESEILSILEINYTDLVLEGFYKGILFSVMTGFLAIGLNYAIKLFTKNI